MKTGKLNVELMGDRELRITRTFDARRQLVFDAHTKPELLKRWLTGPDGWEMAVCEVDLRAGGSFRYELRRNGEPVEEGWDGGPEAMGWGGKFLEVDPPARIVHTELFDEDWTGGETRVTILFRELSPDRTELEMTVLYASKEAREAALQTGMTDGMEMSYVKLDAMCAEAAP